MELNFAAFYLPELLPPPREGGERVLYLDTDTVVLSDVAAELQGLHLGGRPVGVAKDCSQKVGKYLDLAKLKKSGVLNGLPLSLKMKPEACVVNRGVMLVDVTAWAEARLTEAIELLVAGHLRHGPFWTSGVSQPPFLLVASGRYHDLGFEFNVRGLGRNDIAPDEVAYYRKKERWPAHLDGFLTTCVKHCCEGCRGYAFSPHVAPHAHAAKILHFNGRLKPQSSGRRSCKPVAPPSKTLTRADQEARERHPLCTMPGAAGVCECAGLWWDHFPEPPP